MTCIAPISINNTTAIRLAPTRTPFRYFNVTARAGDNAGLKNWAAMTRPALEHHLEMAQNLNK